MALRIPSLRAACSLRKNYLHGLLFYIGLSIGLSTSFLDQGRSCPTGFISLRHRSWSQSLLISGRGFFIVGNYSPYVFFARKESLLVIRLFNLGHGFVHCRRTFSIRGTLSLMAYFSLRSIKSIFLDDIRSHRDAGSVSRSQ